MPQHRFVPHSSSIGSPGAEKGPALTPPDAEAAVRQLISSGEYRNALDRAKEIYKSNSTPAAEALLVDAYVAHIRALTGRGLIVEAKALADLVRHRYPSSRKRLDGSMTSPAARPRSLDELVRPLADPALPLDDRITLERRLQRDVWDLAALASCKALPAEHSLRTAATAIHRAFVAVTSRPVTDDELELHEVSRRSPLAPWKLLVRAIGNFYRGNHQGCEQSLEAIDRESAAARLVPALRSMLNDDTVALFPHSASEGQERPGGGPAQRAGARAPGLSPAALALCAAVNRKPALLRELEALDQGFVFGRRSGLLKLVRSAIEECRRESPERLESLKQHISVRCAVADLDRERVVAAMGGPSRHDATFHRLFARALEETHDPERIVLACAMWNEFQRAAAQEGWFADNGPESAAVSLHMAELLEHLPEPALRKLQFSARRDPTTRDSDISYLSADEQYQRACLLDPHPEAFSRWMAWAARQPGRRANHVAQAWHKIRPDDVQPILHLIDEAEGRRAFGTGIALLAKLERIDSVRPDVRRRRLRLLTGTVVDHVRKKKPAHALDAVDRLAALPESQHGDRPAAVAALRALVRMVRGDVDEAAVCCAEVERVLQDRAGALMLLSTVATAAKFPSFWRLGSIGDLSGTERASLPRAAARIAVLAGELSLELTVPQAWMLEVTRQFPAGKETVAIDGLRALADWAAQRGHTQLAYASTAEGFARGGASDAVFLYLRARAVAGSPARMAVCARAAAELAREQHDPAVVEQALALARGPLGSEPFPLTLDQARDVLRQEKVASQPPGRRTHAPDYSNLLPQCQCADCRRRRGEPVDRLNDLGIDDEDDDGFGLPPGITERMMEELFDAAADAASRGESFDTFASRLFGGPAPGRRSRQRSRSRKGSQ